MSVVETNIYSQVTKVFQIEICLNLEPFKLLNTKQAYLTAKNTILTVILFTLMQIYTCNVYFFIEIIAQIKRNSNCITIIFVYILPKL